MRTAPVPAHRPPAGRADFASRRLEFFVRQLVRRLQRGGFLPQNRPQSFHLLHLGAEPFVGRDPFLPELHRKRFDDRLIHHAELRGKVLPFCARKGEPRSVLLEFLFAALFHVLRRLVRLDVQLFVEQPVRKERAPDVVAIKDRLRAEVVERSGIREILPLRPLLLGNDMHVPGRGSVSSFPPRPPPRTRSFAPSPSASSPRAPFRSAPPAP